MSRYLYMAHRRIGLNAVERRGNDLLAKFCDSLWHFRSAEWTAPHVSELIAAILTARRNSNPVIAMLGGHPIKLGLSRYIIDLIERGLITHVATNGAGIIHDFELALFGGTSEDVARWINVGQFGLWQETSRLNDIISEAAKRRSEHHQSIPLIQILPPTPLRKTRWMTLWFSRHTPDRKTNLARKLNHTRPSIHNAGFTPTRIPSLHPPP